ncbi:MAG TPA: hypothetical protein VHN99_09300 [Deinococcales bacterium]|nr:hypothetical protein [Deinococcales bacterium]
MSAPRRPFAADTTVPVEKTKVELERLVKAHGADGFAQGSKGTRAQVQFEMRGRQLRFVLHLPDATDREVTHSRGGVRRTPAQAREALAQADRTRWRALLLVIKGKLEAVASGVVDFQEEFLPQTVMPNGQTLAEWALPQVARAYETRGMPPMLPGGPS